MVFFYEMTNIGSYKDIIKKHIHRFDSGNCPCDNRWNLPLVNKKVPGLMKNELNGQISYFVDLKLKQYRYKSDGDEDGNKGGRNKT